MKALILAAGGAADPEATPVLLAESDGILLVERFARDCAALGANAVFAVREAEIRRFRIDSVIRLAAGDAAIVPVRHDTAGAACTALLCIAEIDGNDELLIINGNEYLDIDHAAAIDGFRARGLDAGVVSFPSLHPRYSYVRVDSEGLVVEAAEKHPISRHAATGFTWFARGGDFIDAAQAMIRKDAHVDGRFYISLTLNQLILRQLRIGIHPIEARRYHPLKSQRQLSAFEAGPMEAD